MAMYLYTTTFIYLYRKKKLSSPKLFGVFTASELKDRRSFTFSGVAHPAMHKRDESIKLILKN
jgi:hypothetical protein